MKKQSLFSYIKNRYLSAKANSIILTTYTLFVLATLIYSFVLLNFRNVGLCCLYLVFPFLAYLIEFIFKIKFPPLFTLIVFFVPTGGMLGACYDFYTLIPFFDGILHGTTGFIFPCMGFAIISNLLKELPEKKRFYGCLIFAITFSLSISVLWEIFEYLAGKLLGQDMLADTIITDINSHYLAGTHDTIYSIHDINKTIIYYGNNQILTIDGYLDIGVIDTICDMIIHLTCTTLFTIVAIISYYKCPKINKALIPEIK